MPLLPAGGLSIFVEGRSEGPRGVGHVFGLRRGSRNLAYGFPDTIDFDAGTNFIALYTVVYDKENYPI